MSYLVVACEKCRIVLYDPTLIDIDLYGCQRRIMCPVCEDLREYFVIENLSDL